MDTDVDRRFRGSAEAEKYGNIQEFCAYEQKCPDGQGELGVRWQILRRGSQRQDRRAEWPGGRQKTGDIEHASFASLPRVRPLCATAPVEEECEVM